MEIKDNTITIAVDTMGGMCDRLMLGTQGIINNAGYSVECWKFNAPDDNDLQALEEPTTVEDALAILFTDNFHVEVVKNKEEVIKLLEDFEGNYNDFDFDNIPFKEDNTFSLY